MSTETATNTDVSRPTITLLMVLCGIVGAASLGAVSAATIEDDVPSVKVHYDPQSLATDQGARAMYRRLVSAADRVCPDLSDGSPFVSSVTKQCRAQAIARAVHQINNARLAQIHNARSKSG